MLASVKGAPLYLWTPFGEMHPSANLALHGCDAIMLTKSVHRQTCSTHTCQSSQNYSYGSSSSNSFLLDHIVP